jgi:hypothetical protein
LHYALTYRGGWDNRCVAEAHLNPEHRDFMRQIILRVRRIGHEEIQTLRALRERDRAERERLLRRIERMDWRDPGGAAA